MESRPWPVRALLECLPRDRWAVVTSADRGLAETRMHLAGLPKAPLLVAAEDVQAGKPAPDGYRIATEKLGLDCEIVVVFEDPDIGILAVRDAGCPVLSSRRPALRWSSIKSIGLKTLRRFQSNAPIEAYHFVSHDPLG